MPRPAEEDGGCYETEKTLSTVSLPLYGTARHEYINKDRVLYRLHVEPKCRSVGVGDATQCNYARTEQSILSR
jgi:hypothetical protein